MFWYQYFVQKVVNNISIHTSFNGNNPIFFAPFFVSIRFCPSKKYFQVRQIESHQRATIFGIFKQI